VGQRVALELEARSALVPARAHAHFVVAECLTPELAEDLAGAGIALFVDAASDGRPAGEVTVRPVAASDLPSPGGPNCLAPAGCWADLTPEGILGLAHDLYGSTPPALVVSVGIVHAVVGEGLSDPVEAAVPRAVRVAEEALESWESGLKPTRS
jgi:Ni,Fe-hydrogenase maturation factor